MRLYYRLTTKEPLVLSQSTATTNNHLGLDHIPGSALLGAIASRLYNQLDDAQSFAVFHSGACRFGPAYPLVNDEICLPMPAAWHSTKHDSAALSNHAAPSFVRDAGLQYKQCREGYISHQLQEAKVNQGLTTRTALDEGLRVKDGQLYTYTTIQAGQEFGGWVESDDAQLLELIKPLLNGELSVGRSRSSEFGRIQLSCSAQQPQTPEVASLGNSLVIWCLSDAQFFNHLGSPTFTPAASELHTQLSGTLNAEKSFIRTRKVRRFNRARNGLDSEQQLVAAGSVLVYELEQPASTQLLQELASHGVGANRQQGLGWIKVNPTWALQAQPQGQLFTPIKLAAVAQPAVKVETTALLHWVNNQLGESNLLQDMEQLIGQLHQKICAAYVKARDYNSLPNQYQAGPSSSQWRRLDELVKKHQNWQQYAFEYEQGQKPQNSTVICKERNDELGWGLSWQDEQGLVTFARFAKEHLGGLNSQTMRRLLEQLCRFDLSDYQGLQAYKKFNATAQQGVRA
ncbi:hypothetical protein VQ643_10520 [Pseudomonas sp. F1_0610]|uniref:hypothetical protein n=1 Tax=Pseudomonas sp. F1_0610 TaxID=3114284 RepID=UPI0039C31BC9